MTVIMHTVPSAVGEAAAEGIGEILARSTSGVSIATYAEGAPPVSWAVLEETGWDAVGVVEDEESATLRDLVEMARVWGRSLVQLPLMTTVLVKRHVDGARELEGPLSVAVHLPSEAPGVAYAPFAQVPDVRLAGVVGAGVGEEGWLSIAGAVPDDWAPTLAAAEIGGATVFSADAAREFAVVWAAEASGAAERLLEDTVAYVRERQQFGKPVGSFQAVKHHLANALIAVELAETAVIRASEDPGSAFASASYAVSSSIEAAEICIQAHGGMGFTWEMGLHFSLRHMLAVRELIAGLAGA